MSKRPNYPILNKDLLTGKKGLLNKNNSDELPIPCFQKAQFLKSAYKPSQFPNDEGKEVAFIGRSNVGKSTVINTLTGLRKLARTSKTPGRTQLFNFFEVDFQKRFVDIPGTGYAKVSQSLRAHWQNILYIYLNKRLSLCGIIFIIDCRHLLQAIDYEILEIIIKRHIPLHILLNKSDKLSARESQLMLKNLKKGLEQYPISAQLFSGKTRLGVTQTIELIKDWLT